MKLLASMGLAQVRPNNQNSDSICPCAEAVQYKMALLKGCFPVLIHIFRIQINKHDIDSIVSSFVVHKRIYCSFINWN